MRREDMETMSIKETIISEILKIAEQEAKEVQPLTEDLVLLESGLDSLMVAILVTRLEEILGLDPFTDAEDVYYPVTLGDFIRSYEQAASKA